MENNLIKFIKAKKFMHFMHTEVRTQNVFIWFLLLISATINYDYHWKFQPEFKCRSVATHLSIAVFELAQRKAKL